MGWGVLTGSKGGSSLDAKILEAIDEGLLLLGENPREALYLQLERVFKLRREEIPHKLETFHICLEHYFDAGSRTLEQMITKTYCRKVNLIFDEDRNLSLIDYVRKSASA